MALLAAVGATQAVSAAAKTGPKFTKPAAFDVSRPLRELAKAAKATRQKGGQMRPERGRAVASEAYSADAAVQAAPAAPTIAAPLQNFEGLSNQANFDIFGGRVNPPDPVRDVGPNHYVEMLNLTFAVYYVFPGIRYTGRLAGDVLGQMTLGEGTIVNGTASQTDTNSRWGDYTSLNVDPVDDCTFWYVNEYYTVEGAAQAPLGNGWQTRIASFRLPGC